MVSTQGELRSAAAPALVSPEAEARAFWRMRFRRAATAVRQAFSEARFRVSLILILSAFLWAVLFWLFAEGFVFLRSSMPTDWHDETVRVVLGMFFVTLFVMLIFSSAIILYGSLYRSPDVSLLLTLPSRVERIFLVKFQEAIILSSWAFVLLGSPMLVAYGITADALWYYYALLVPFLVSFVYIPAGIGAIACLLLAHRLPSGRMLWLLVLGVGAVVGGALVVWSITARPASNILTPAWFQEMLTRLQFTEHRLLPSWWLTQGLLEAAPPDARVAPAPSQSVLFLTLLISNALFLQLLAVLTAGRVFRASFDRFQGKRAGRRRSGVALVDRMAGWLISPLPVEMQLLIVKDLRLFRRDPVQWSQSLIFVGLLFLYFINIRQFQYDTYYIGWVNMVSFLNVSVVGLLLSTFTTRFIFPMISLEGRRFWVLGLLPVRRERILTSKFLFAVGGSLVPCSGLVLLSDLMLRVQPVILAGHQLTCVILCCGLSGIAVGLGAKMPSLREESPSRIAAGFGGTLNLVLSTFYILAVVLLTALPSHFYLGAYQGRASEFLARAPYLRDWLGFWLVAGTIGSVLLGVLATLVPLAVGFRAFRRLEF